MSDSQRPLRYVLGPISSPVQIDVLPSDSTDPDAPPTVDRIARLGLISKDGVTLIFPGDPGVAYVDPVECRAYFVPSGADVPTSVDGFLSSPLAFAIHEGQVPQGPDSTLVLPIPAGATRGSYLVQSVYGFSQG